MAMDAVAHPDKQLTRDPFGSEARDQDTDQQQDGSRLEPMSQLHEEAPNGRHLQKGGVGPLS